MSKKYVPKQLPKLTREARKALKERLDNRPITLITGQWGDMSADELFKIMQEIGYDGLELACGTDHFDVRKWRENVPVEVMVDGKKMQVPYQDFKTTQLQQHQLGVWALSNHCVGQCVLDKIDKRHYAITPSYLHDKDPEKFWQNCAQEMIDTAKAAKALGANIVTGFTGSSIWNLFYCWPPVPGKMINEGYKLLKKRWTPILDEYEELGVKFALEVHPTEIAFDIWSALRTLEELDCHPAFGFNFDPSHLLWQRIDPVEFIRMFPDRIYHVHMKDAALQLDGKNGLLISHLPFADPRCGWSFRSLGHGDVDFEKIIRALNDIRYEGPLSVEWEDSGMDRKHGAKEAYEFVKKLKFPISEQGFENFDKPQA
ncbi:MAG: sugar phosphate isomerase/epimerase [Thermoguttaceae bacterium]|nr:sugar phosphate isomerase/epimerase [Thermoguttaceae bacterium]